jgi:hypothetical protein
MPKRARAKSIKISKKIKQNPEKRKKVLVSKTLAVTSQCRISLIELALLGLLVTFLTQ